MGKLGTFLQYLDPHLDHFGLLLFCTEILELEFITEPFLDHFHGLDQICTNSGPYYKHCLRSI